MDTLPAVWEIYDLSNDDLQALATKLAAPNEGQHAALMAAVSCEMSERTSAHKLYAVITAQSDHSAEVPPAEHTEHSWLAFCPPWYRAPEQATETETSAAAAASVPKQRGMWDSSDSDTSDIRHPVEGKKTAKKLKKPTSQMNSLGIFVVNTKKAPSRRSSANFDSPVIIKSRTRSTTPGCRMPTSDTNARRKASTPVPTVTAPAPKAKGPVDPTLRPPLPKTRRKLPIARAPARDEFVVPPPSHALAIKAVSAPTPGDDVPPQARMSGEDVPLYTDKQLSNTGTSADSSTSYSAVPMQSVSVPLLEKPLVTVEGAIQDKEVPANSPASTLPAIIPTVVAPVIAPATAPAAVPPAVPAAVPSAVAGVKDCLPPPEATLPASPLPAVPPAVSSTISTVGLLAPVVVPTSPMPVTQPVEPSVSTSVVLSPLPVEPATVLTPAAVAGLPPPSAAMATVGDRGVWSSCRSLEEVLIEPFHMKRYTELPHAVVIAALRRLLEEIECSLAEDPGRSPSSQLCRIQKSRSEVYALVQQALLNGGTWHETEAPCWNLWWSWNRPLPQDAVWLVTQRANHIPHSKHLTRKDLIKKSIHHYARGQGPGAKHFQSLMPSTFVLPSEFTALAEAFYKKKGIWIMKTIGLSRGRGITLVSSLDDVVYSDPVVVQQYIDRPLVINGRKFDLRLYVLVSQFNPLECFISSLGFARFACKAYTTGNIADKFVHLTNTSIARDGACGGDRDTKWTLDTLASFIGSSWEGTWAAITLAVLKVVATAERQIPHNPCCFELFGFDVLLGEDCQPWVLEVNASPSLEIDCVEDERVKPQLLQDIVSVLQLPAINREALKQAVTDRLDQLTNRRKSSAHRQDTLKTLDAIFSSPPRPYGQPPAQPTSFSMIAPSTDYNRIRHWMKTSV